MVHGNYVLYTYCSCSGHYEAWAVPPQVPITVTNRVSHVNTDTNTVSRVWRQVRMSALKPSGSIIVSVAVMEIFSLHL